MAAEFLAYGLAAYLLTYLIHSTLLLAGAWLLETVFEFVPARLRERLWRAALLGGFATAGLQLGLGLQTPWMHWVLRPAPALASLEAAAPELAPFGPAAPGGVPRPLDARRAALDPAEGPRQPWPSGAAAAAPEGPAPTGAPPAATVDTLPRALEAERWVPWLARGFGALALAALSLLALAAARLHGRLRGAVRLTEGPEVDCLAELCRRARCARPVRLLVAPALRSPLTSGLFRPAICVPPRALVELTRAEREAMLAHELGHVVRRDPAWLTAYWLVGRVCFFQPFNVLARRRLAECAECLADDWAVRHTGSQVPLASCLARIAGWLTERPRLLTAHMTPGRAAGRARSLLGRRIERLLEERPRTDEPLRRWWSPAALGLFGALALGAPGVAARAPGGEPAPRPSSGEEPASLAQDAEPAAPAATLDGELAALDGEVAELERELELLRADLAPLASDPAVSRALRGLETHARALTARRDRMQSLIRAPELPRVRP